jgi:hypothetical protein
MFIKKTSYKLHKSKNLTNANKYNLQVYYKMCRMLGM